MGTTANNAEGKGRLTTHVLDTMHGKPAAGLSVILFRITGNDRELLLTTRTNSDGRCDAPLLSGAAMVPGVYELVFDVAAYFREAGVSLENPPFLDRIPLRFGLSNAGQHYHVPLLVSPFAYSTYRGS